MQKIEKYSLVKQCNTAGVVAVAVGRLAYGSAADSLWWYGWLASTGFAGGIAELDRQTDRKCSGLAQH